MNIQILYEDENVLVVNKPAGILVHGIYDKHGAKHDEEVLTDWIVEKHPQMKEVGDDPKTRPGVVHRLDRETSGVLVIAKTQKAFLFLKNLFKERSLEKTYIALVWGKVKDKFGVIDKPISIKKGSVKRTVFQGKMPRDAVTEYKVINYLKLDSFDFTLLKAKPKTGRTHQIRVHLNSIGHPVVGDKLYSKKRIFAGLDRHFLHAKELELPLPNGKRIKVVADLPKDLQDILDMMEK